MKVISLGWGVQSFGLAAMSALGVLPPVDVAIHADTTHERTATYEFAERWTPWLEERGVRVVTVKAAESVPLVDKWNGLAIPAFTDSPRGVGQTKRQCTADWKIDPMKRWIQANRNKQPVEQWIGISLDEVGRVKPSHLKYITHRWPLIEREMRRADVVRWLTEQGIEIPPRSACYFCPYQSRKEWRALQDTPDWQRAVAVDESIRNHRGSPMFLHSSRIPLAQVDFRSPQEKGQLELDLFENECSGVCGI